MSDSISIAFKTVKQKKKLKNPRCTKLIGNFLGYSNLKTVFNNFIMITWFFVSSYK